MLGKLAWNIMDRERVQDWIFCSPSAFHPKNGR
jgi:hypothetical protein